MANEYVVYISSHAVQMIYGSCDKQDMIKIEKYMELPLEEGAIINGVVIDENQILEQLKELKGLGVDKARCVIDSGQILLKNIKVPFLKNKELQKIAKDELADIDGSYEDLVYDYSVLRPSFEDSEEAGGEILCCAMERKLLASYIDLFKNADIALKSIDISVNALHKLTQELADLEGQTYIVSILDNNNVSSYLFENNHYTFSNRSRLFSERGTQEFIVEMNSNISQLIQFSKSKHSPYTIQTAYFCGLDGDEKLKVLSNIKENLGIDAKEFPNSKLVYVVNRHEGLEFVLHRYVFPVGCLIRK